MWGKKPQKISHARRKTKGLSSFRVHNQAYRLLNLLKVRLHSHSKFLVVLRLLLEISSANIQNFCSVPFRIFNKCEETSTHSMINSGITILRGNFIPNLVANVTNVDLCISKWF